ncbi:hypothetical protein Snoj_23570 [Streptomyces nojiriensis]|uniref:Uncharacterized protein n=1 Tax=Streptomyces nojiriensis TaxID=66374 RepID=A0ABQ3SJW7_9ACTN|nr:hypothetical protein GCM10010205_60340 [Streptomyces nojiriensis]GHI68439.1 hypothetical protein Snoj_23570 [Streptomyces nojiriensis]
MTSSTGRQVAAVSGRDRMGGVVGSSGAMESFMESSVRRRAGLRNRAPVIVRHGNRTFCYIECHFRPLRHSGRANGGLHSALKGKGRRP